MQQLNSNRKPCAKLTKPNAQALSRPRTKSASFLEYHGVHHKMGIAFFLASLVPILLMLYVITFHLEGVLPAKTVWYCKLFVFLSLCAALLGFYINRRIASALSDIVKRTKITVEQGVLDHKIVAQDHATEIGELVKVFNQIIGNLEEKIAALRQSKKLIQNLLNKVGSVINSPERMDHLLGLVVEGMVDALDSEAGMLILASPLETEFRSKLAYGKQSGRLLEMSENGQKKMFDQALREGKTFLYDRAKCQSKADLEIGNGWRSLACVPLGVQSRTLGVIALANKRSDHGFTQDDLVLLENVATQVALALENARLNADAEKTYVETVAALAMAVEAKDVYTRGHLKRVSELVEKMARAMGIDEKKAVIFKDAALLHDIGKIAVDDRILNKRGELSEKEWVVMKAHTVTGEKIIAPLTSFKELRGIVRHHQEWYDGSGYPDGFQGDEIPLGARILAVADVYDALTTERPYRKALSHDTAIEMMRRETGTHFDPAVIEIFFGIVHSNRKAA